MKTLAFIHRNDTRFAVGDFSPVLSVLSYQELGSTVSPFLLLDHIGPGRLRPDSGKRGVNPHPHRGFETVTLVLSGELQHRDSQGHGGVLGAGDVQWMTTGRGVIHEERFSDAFLANGGRFEMLQLWVNLPSRDKMMTARYQHLATGCIPATTLPSGTRIRVIAGCWQHLRGPAETRTRVQLLEVHLMAGDALPISVPEGDTAMVYLLSGSLAADDGNLVEEHALLVYGSHEADLLLITTTRAHLLVMTGEPLNEPVFGHGPFVMNNHAEIVQAYEDVKAGNLEAPAGH